MLAISGQEVVICYMCCHHLSAAGTVESCCSGNFFRNASYLCFSGRGQTTSESKQTTQTNMSITIHRVVDLQVVELLCALFK